MLTSAIHPHIMDRWIDQAKLAAIARYVPVQDI